MLLLSWNLTTPSFNCLFLQSSHYLCPFMFLKHGMLIRLRKSHFIDPADWNECTTGIRLRSTEDCTCEVISSNRYWFESVIIFLSLSSSLCHSMLSLLCFVSLKTNNLSTSKFKLNINLIASLLQNRDAYNQRCFWVFTFVHLFVTSKKDAYQFTWFYECNYFDTVDHLSLACRIDCCTWTPGSLQSLESH
jgi:hypothetical protein